MVVQADLGLSLADFIRLFAESPFELVDGERIPVVPNVAEHTEILKLLYSLLLLYEAAHKSVSVYSESPYVLLYTSDWVRGSRVPDIMLYNAERMAAYKASTPDWRGKPFVIVPDVCIEILSPNDSSLDMDDKIERYFEDGVQQVWVMNPRRQYITIYTRDSTQFTRLTVSATLSGGDLMPDFTLPVSAIFAV